jgi:hypothetical protein
MSTDSAVELNTETTITDEAIEAPTARVENSVEVPRRRAAIRPEIAATTS